MNRIIIAATLFVLVLSSKIAAQEFHGTAVYESKTHLGNIEIKGKDKDDEMVKMIKESLKKQSKKYVLHFNRYESIYEEEQQLEAPSGGNKLSFTSSGGTGKDYKNIKDQVQIAEEDLGGKEFLVIDSLKTWKWELKEETKKIGNYTCYKAVSIDRVTAEDLKKYEDSKKKQEEGTTNFFGTREPKDSMTTVWYTPEIPVSQGPQDIWGLPGLILEANFNDVRIILCSKIVLNPKAKTEIKKPTKGKKVTKKEYDSLIEKYMEQMEDMWSREKVDERP